MKPRSWSTIMARSAPGFFAASLALSCAMTALAPTPAVAQAAPAAQDTLSEGRSALSAGAFDLAESLFRQALEERPDSSGAMFGLAVSLDKLGRTDEALPLFDTLIKDRPNDANPVFFRGVARYRTGALNAAIADFEAAIGLGADFAAIRMRLGDAHYAKGDFEAALEAYRRAIAAPDPPSHAFRSLGNALYASGDFARAEEAYTEALRGDPRDGRAALHRAWTRQILGRGAEALADLDRAVEIRGGVDPDVSAARGDLFRRRGALSAAILDYQRAVEIDPRHRGALRGAAAALLADGRPAAAKTILDQLIDQLGRENRVGASALRLRGEALLRLGDPRAAEADLSLALRLDPGVSVAHYNRALARALTEDLAGALEDMRQAAALAPRDAEAAYGLMRAAIAAGLKAEAAEATRRAEALGANQAAARPARAAAMLAFGRAQEALSLTNDHLAEKPRNLRSLHLKIRALFALGRHQEALDLSRRLIAIEPRRAINHLFEAEARLALDQPEQARAALQQANALGAAPARIARLASNAWLATETPDAMIQAANALDAAVSLSDQSPEDLVARAAARERMGELETALEDLNRAVAAQLQNADFRLQRARLLKKLDNCSAAIRDYDLALDIRPGDGAAMAERATCKFDQGRVLGGITDYVASWF